MSEENAAPQTAQQSAAPLTGDAFTEIAPLYDELMFGVPYDEWVNYLHVLLERRRIEPHRVLDLACGTGNVSEILAEEGYEVVGADISPGMIASARRKAEAKGLDIAYHVQDAAELRLAGPPFDLCVCLFDSLNYILKPERLALALSGVREHLRPGGLFVFDLNTDFALINHFFDQDNLKTKDRLRYDWRSTYYPSTRLCKVDMEFFLQQDDGTESRFEETHWQFAYRHDEILRMLEAAGFTNPETFQAYTLREPSPTSDRIFYVVARPTTH